MSGQQGAESHGSDDERTGDTGEVRAYEGKRRVTANGALMWYERVMRAWAGVVVAGLSHPGH